MSKKVLRIRSIGTARENVKLLNRVAKEVSFKTKEDIEESDHPNTNPVLWKDDDVQDKEM